ncbi:hypothetical protein [Haladaptatus caseinilyticus]|uniref:hypothetical protein n=1 Tax=Haladaptatus caseinilyticus TaxID=2993314 RepID=UPI00224A587E|nr:hypothetical protein [Haladaptatus caseinilyticus]
MERQDTQPGEYGAETEEIADIAEMDITDPTLTWLEVSRPQQPIPIGENDRVLDSKFNEQHDVWEVLLIALPEEKEDEE